MGNDGGFDSVIAVENLFMVEKCLNLMIPSLIHSAIHLPVLIKNLLG